jgi:gliding motility-associated-like protein
VITFNSPPICKNDSVKFKATSYDPTLLSGFAWIYGDGSSSALGASNQSTYAYTKSGAYNVALVTQDILGCYDTVPGSINIYGPTADFTNLNSTCTKYPVTFTDQSTSDGINPIKKWIWDFGDGSTVTFGSPPFTHTYNVADTFSVSLKIVDSVGCTDTISKINAISTVPRPVASFTMNPSPDCFSTPVSFADNSQGQQLGRIWYFGNGDTSSFPAPVYTYADTGHYVVTLIIGKQAGCSDTLAKPLQVLPLPSVDAGLDTVICFGQSLTLNATGANLYKWNNDPSLSCTQCSNPTANPQSSTTYYVLGKDAFGCTASDSIFVEVKEPITITLASKDTVCFGSSIQLKASGAEIYSWQPSTGLSNPNIPNPVATPADTGTIVYTVAGTDTKGCFNDTATTTLIVAPMPQFNIIDTNVTIAAGATYIIKTTSSPDVVSWQWSPPTDLSCTNCPEPVAKGDKIVQYTGIATNSYGCSVSDKILMKGLCNSQVIFIPNTFSPTGDHVNDYFYPRGSGLYLIKTMRIFNRVGQLVYEKNNFAPDVETEGWDGTFHSKKLSSDVYVYFIEVMCNNGVVVSFKGNVTLL